MNSLLLGCAVLVLLVTGGLSNEKGYTVSALTSSETVNLRPSPGFNNKPIGGFVPGACDIKIIGKAVMRNKIEWVPIEYHAIKGWMDRRFLSETTEQSEISEFHVYSPSGRITISQTMRSGLGIGVIKDGIHKGWYGIGGGIWGGSVRIFFSDDENVFAYDYGGASMGEDVYAFKRGVDGKFQEFIRHEEHEENSLCDRCWRTLRENARIPDYAKASHLRLHVEGVKGKEFSLSMGGNYSGGGKGQTNFGPFKFLWSADADKLRLVH